MIELRCQDLFLRPVVQTRKLPQNSPCEALAKPAQGFTYCFSHAAFPRRRAPEHGSASQCTWASGGIATSIPRLLVCTTRRYPGLFLCHAAAPVSDAPDCPCLCEDMCCGISFCSGVKMCRANACAQKPEPRPHDGQPSVMNPQTIMRQKDVSMIERGLGLLQRFVSPKRLLYKQLAYLACRDFVSTSSPSLTVSCPGCLVKISFSVSSFGYHHTLQTAPRSAGRSPARG
jgi:hypothetical protein